MDQLTNRRRELGLTQTAVAQLIGAKQGYISSLERGKITPTVQTIQKLYDAIGLSPMVWFKPPDALSTDEAAA